VPRRQRAQSQVLQDQYGPPGGDFSDHGGEGACNAERDASEIARGGEHLDLETAFETGHVDAFGQPGVFGVNPGGTQHRHQCGRSAVMVELGMERNVGEIDAFIELLGKLGVEGGAAAEHDQRRGEGEVMESRAEDGPPRGGRPSCGNIGARIGAEVGATP